MDRQRNVRAIVVHAIRISIVAALLLLIPSPRSKRSVDENGLTPPAIDLIHKTLPAAAEVRPAEDANGFWTVNDSSGKPIARVARTLPQASDVIGYRGPSEALILVDQELNLRGVDLIQSSDTDEHVATVQRDPAFFEQFRRWKWGGPQSGETIDAVSGATLTSLAIAKGVLKRIGGDRPSLVFPAAVVPEELKRWFPEATGTREENDLTVAVDRNGATLGQVIRTGPLSDSVVGYQGPTELLIKMDPTTSAVVPESDAPMSAAVSAADRAIVADIQIRSSFDNEPYVGYCRTEYGFWSLFKGKSVDELARLDLEANRVEGVSGATMSSMAIAETLVSAAKEYQSRVAARSKAETQDASIWTRWSGQVLGGIEIRLTAPDVGCVVVLLCIPLFRAKGWFRKKSLRVLWLIAVVVVIGFWSGNLISMALVAGWSAEGIAWRLAPALAAITVVAFVSPIVGKSNPYCNHLCPHGAIQQLVKPTRKSKRHWKPPARLIAVIQYLPGFLIVCAYLTLLRIPSVDLSSWEPFHAYLLRIAPWTALSFAGVTILFSAFVPMGYCRLGCPTGRLLDHLRRSAGSDRLKWPDAVAVALLLLAVLSRVAAI